MRKTQPVLHPQFPFISPQGIELFQSRSLVRQPDPDSLPNLSAFYLIDGIQPKGYVSVFKSLSLQTAPRIPLVHIQPDRSRAF